MSATRKSLAPVMLSRATTWTADRIAKLKEPLDVRQLAANAERLGEPEIAVLCEADLTRRRREKLAAPKPAGWKPKPKPKKVEEEE
jgi:hypothetical protein